ncbi:hypothetical protein AGLY_011856, partial [Aphis glycines]
VGEKGGFCFNGLNTPKFNINDLYFLNNNKYLKSFENKLLSLRYFFSLKLLEGKLMENLVLYKHKKFYDFSISKLLANFHDFDIFQQLIRNFAFNFQVLWPSEISTFLSYNHIKKSIWSKTGFANCLLLTCIIHQGYPLCYRKPPSKFKIEALFQLEIYTNLTVISSLIIEYNKISDMVEHDDRYYQCKQTKHERLDEISKMWL